MTVKELAERMDMRVIVGPDLEREIKDCYLCDMLSFVMARAKEGDAWITVQTNINVVAVASLADCACVIIPEEIPVEEATIEKARGQDINILSARQTAFRIALEIGRQLS